MGTFNPISFWESRGVARIRWDNVTGSGSVVNPGNSPSLPVHTVQISGTFQSAKVTIQGSNASTPTVSGFYAPLSDLAGNALSALSSGVIERIAENPRWIKPYVSGSTGGTTVDVVLVSYGEG